MIEAFAVDPALLCCYLATSSGLGRVELKEELGDV